VEMSRAGCMAKRSTRVGAAAAELARTRRAGEAALDPF